MLEVKPRQVIPQPAGKRTTTAEPSKRESAVPAGKLDIQWVTRLNGIIELARQLVHVFGGFLVIGLMLTVANTLRLYIFSRRSGNRSDEAGGCNGWFYPATVSLSGFWYGVVGGLVALVAI